MVFVRYNEMKVKDILELNRGADMASVDFTLDELLTATAEQTRRIVKDELVGFEPRVKKIVKLEVMESEGRIKREIMDYVDVKTGELRSEIIDGVGDLFTSGIQPVYDELAKVNARFDRFSKAAGEI